MWNTSWTIFIHTKSCFEKMLVLRSMSIVEVFTYFYSYGITQCRKSTSNAWTSNFAWNWDRVYVKTYWCWARCRYGDACYRIEDSASEWWHMNIIFQEKQLILTEDLLMKTFSAKMVRRIHSDEQKERRLQTASICQHASKRLKIFCQESSPAMRRSDETWRWDVSNAVIHKNQSRCLTEGWDDLRASWFRRLNAMTWDRQKKAVEGIWWRDWEDSANWLAGVPWRESLQAMCFFNIAPLSLSLSLSLSPLSNVLSTSRRPSKTFYRLRW